MNQGRRKGNGMTQRYDTHENEDGRGSNRSGREVARIEKGDVQEEPEFVEEWEVDTAELREKERSQERRRDRHTKRSA